jgi:hypothetical protein
VSFILYRGHNSETNIYNNLVSELAMLVSKYIENMNKQTEEISYKELARRVGDMVMANNLRKEVYKTHEFDLENGEESYCYKHETPEECQKDSDNCDFEYYDIYQEYIITAGGADYLTRNTNEIVFYNEKLDIYLWGITHFGTGWSAVFTSLIEK